MKKTIGKVLKLYITKNDVNKTRLSKESIIVDEKGVQGDKFYGKDLQRSILITTQESYDLALLNNIDIDNGVLGENILIDINPYSLLPGQRLIIGDALLEITQNCTLCKGLTSIDSKLPKLLKDDRGIFAKALNEVTISLDSEVKILNN